jgi:hypothetical protein
VLRLDALDNSQFNDKSNDHPVKARVDPLVVGAIKDASVTKFNGPLEITRLTNPNKYFVVKMVPTIWNWGLKNIVRKIHDRLAPIPEDEDYDLVRKERAFLYDNMYSHLGEPLANQEVIAKVGKILKTDAIM